MKSCPKCNTGQVDDQAKYCSSCGLSFTPDTKHQSQQNDDDKLEFVVTEKDNDDREFVGGQKNFGPENDLGVEKPEDILEREATSSVPDPTESDLQRDFDSGSHVEPPSLYFETEPASTQETPSHKESESTDAEASTSKKSGGIKKLSKEEIKKIEMNLYGDSGHLSDKEKEALSRKLDSVEQPFGNTPINPRESPIETPVSKAEDSDDLPPPRMSDRGRGIAYFYKNYIQISGNCDFYPDDDLVVGERVFELRPKKIDPKFLFISAAVVFALVLIGIGSLFVSGNAGEEGSIVGIVLDEYDQPFLQGAMIRFPDLSKTIQSNTQGFFKSGDLPAGSHKIELLLDNEVVYQDYTTIAAGEINTVILQSEIESTELASEEKSAKTSTTPDNKAKIESGNKPGSSTPPAEAAKKTSTTQQKIKSNSEAPTRLTLAANVEGARIALDGSVLGAGNLTYKGLQPRTYKYEVSKDGHKPATGEITLVSGKANKLSVELLPLDAEVKKKSYTAEDFFYSASTAHQQGDLTGAVTDFTEAIALEPSYAEAYMLRGEIYAGVKEWSKAYDDFVRAAEILQVRNDYSRSLTAYNQAVEIDKKSITAYLGRANVFMALNEERAAIFDFETVLKYDKRNAQALFGLGKARFQQGNTKQAIKHFKDARSVNSENPLVHQYMMLCYLADDDFKNMKKSYEKFMDVASEADIYRLRNDSRFAAVLRVAENER